MNLYVVDIETDGLNASKIHVMSAGWKSEDSWKVTSTSNYDSMRSIITNPDNVIVGHFFKMFDIKVLEDILDVKAEAKIIDTLFLSWVLYPERRQGTFGLDQFGRTFGIEKPKIDDWENLTYEDYAHRCEEDVKINIALWEDLVKRMSDLYGSYEESQSFINYIMFKADCLVDQEDIRTRIDIDMVKANMAILEELALEREEILVKAMPRGPVLKERPKKMYKKDKSISSIGQKWFDFLKERGLPLTTQAVYKDPAPTSTSQVKEWLFSLGWEPETFKDGANGPVPQIRTDKKELCPSVLKLSDKEPAILALDGYTVINHRLGVLKSFLDTVDRDGYTVAGATGFTNTMRLKHSKPIVNLPGVTGDVHEAMEGGMSKKEAVSLNLRDGQIIRECIIAPEGYEVCGSDITSLEDNTKRHYMYFYDPEYVIEQMEEGFDPHLDLALRAGAVTEDQVDQHKKGEIDLKPIRSIYKVANYSCIYGVGAAKLADTVKISVREARNLIKSYWDRNWSIKQLPKDIKVKNSYGVDWLFNPVSKMWYSVRSEKDIFSTLNQGTGAYVFDLWLLYMVKEGVKPFLQYHDEIAALSKIGERDKTKRIVEESMKKVNEVLKLNIEITVDVQFGSNYAEVH